MVRKWQRAPEHARGRRVRVTKRHRGYVRPLVQLGMYRCSCHGDLWQDVIAPGEGGDPNFRVIEPLDRNHVSLCGGMR